MKKFLLAGLLFSFLLAGAQEKKDARPMQWKDIASWRSVPSFNVSLSPDGRWVAYPLLTREGDGELIIKKLKDTLTRKYPVGGTTFANFAFSEDGKWIAFKELSKYSEIKAAAKSPGKQLFEKLVIVELATGKKTEYERAGSFAFNGKQSTHLAVSLVKERGTARPDDPRSTDLLLIELGTGKSQNIGNAGEFSFNKSGDYLAYTIDAANKTGNGLYLLHLPAGRVSVLDNGKATYKSISWNEDGDAFALLRMEKDEKYKTEKGSVIGVKNISAAAPAVTVYNPVNDSLHFPKSYTVSGNRRPYWADDRNRLFFGIAPLELAKKEDKAADTLKAAKEPAAQEMTEKERLEKIKADTSIKSLADLRKALAKLDSAKTKPAAAPAKNNADKPDMTIWHWQDKRLQSRQQVQEMMDKNFSYVGVYDVAAKKIMQVNDGTRRNATILPKQRYAIVTDESEYELDINLDGQSYTDVYFVDLSTGQQWLFEKKFYQPSFTSRPQPSPDGTKFIYGKDGHYYVYDIAARSSVNITESAPVSFVNTDDDHNVIKPLMPVLGWTSDSRQLLVRDLWDIWLLAANGKEATNLTRTGRDSRVRHTSRYMLDYEEKGIDTKQPLYVRLYGEWTKKSGIGRIEAGKKGWQPGVNVLLWEDAQVASLSKAKNAPVYMYAKEKFSDPTTFYVADEKLAAAEQATKNAPDRNKYAWSPGVRLVNYVSDKGDSLQGALFLPAGYEQGKKYPTVVYYYEKMSQTLHSYSNPDYPGGAWNPAMYTSNGYAVFMPDIVYKLDDPGMSAVWCVLPGVKAAIATGVVDEKNIGIHGHSWGGYQTCFLATQTNMFKAAAAGAALTNMVSMYDLIYWNSGGGNMAIFEASQGRFRGGPWDNWDSYLRNSPVYHVKKMNTPLLLLHNDKDGAVDFTQGIEFYNALR
ncbi:MAG TPA: prolyl oligopeptidase family serine peptidase, partial [Chitinophagaceae bacterium]|nr:prolyl oligopeptidase family serine peptidase [Chitinophagaceae bacterium]